MQKKREDCDKVHHEVHLGFFLGGGGGGGREARDYANVLISNILSSKQQFKEHINCSI